MVDPSSLEMADFSHLGPGFEAFYEDEQSDDTIPKIQHVTRSNNNLPLWGDKGTMNINSLVLQNIVSSPYFKQQLAEISIFHPLLDEIYYNVRGVGAGGIVSSAFCLLFKLFAVKLTRKNLVQMINYEGCNFIRGLGFLYIRYCQPPEDMWDWFEPYLDDKEEIDPRAGGGDMMSIGQMCKTLLTKLDWYSTLFPRIPVPIQKQIEAKFIELRRRKDKESREKVDTTEQTWTTADDLFAASEHLREDKLRDNRRSKSKEAPNRDRDAAGSSRGRDGDKRSDPVKDVRERRNFESSRDDETRRRGSKCAHHKRHHHCLKHKLRCPRKATQNRPEKSEKNGNDSKRDNSSSKTREREKDDRKERDDKREERKDDRRERDEKRDGRDKDSRSSRHRDDSSSRRRSRSPSSKRSRRDDRDRR